VPDIKRYLANPDVSCREDDLTEGALLFNPDTDGMLTVNPTGLLIWLALSQPRTCDEIVDGLLQACDDVPLDEVDRDVDEFVTRLLPGGFVGEVL
jgi:hypothetical protein